MLISISNYIILKIIQLDKTNYHKVFDNIYIPYMYTLIIYILIDSNYKSKTKTKNNYNKLLGTIQ